MAWTSWHKYKYGITEEQYDELDTGSCYICQRSWGGSVRPCVDHNHKTGEIRGIICLYCNRYVVGRHTDPDVLYRTSEYLRNSRTGWIVPKRVKKRKKKK